MFETDSKQLGDAQKQAWEPVVGSTVRLKSGGPVMTVINVTSASAQCAWFMEQALMDPYRPQPVWGESQKETFPFAALDQYHMEVK